MLKIKGLWAALAAVLAAAPAAAQITAPREAAQIELGPMSLYPSLQILDAGLDENVFNDGTAPQRDYTMTVASRMLAVVRVGQNELLFQTGNDYVWFKEFTQERSSNAQYAMRFNLSASRFKPFVGLERIRTRTRPSPEIDARARRVDRAVLGGLNYELSPRTSLTAAVRFDDSMFDEGERFRGVALDDALNRTGRGGEAGMRYALTPLTTMAVLAGYEEENFETSRDRNTTRYTLGPTFEFSPEASLRGRATVVAESFRPSDPRLGERLGLAYTAGLNWSLYGRTTFDLMAGRNISYSYLEADPYYLLTHARLTVGQPIFGRFDVYGGFDWERMAYTWRRGAVRPGGQEDRVDRLTGLRGGVGVNVGQGIRVRVGVEEIRRRSIEDPLQNFDRTRILSTVTVGS